MLQNDTKEIKALNYNYYNAEINFISAIILPYKNYTM